MADDRNSVGGQDRARINVSEAYKVEDGIRSLEVLRERPQKAIGAVGDRAEDVRARLAR